MTHLNSTLRDFCLRQNRLVDYPSLLSQTHPNPLSANFVKLNIMFNKIGGLR